MKTKTCIFLSLTLMLCCMPTTYAYDPRTLKIDGKDILAGETVDGVTFSENVLTLDNVTVSSDERYGIYIKGFDELTINLVGRNNIHTTGEFDIFVHENHLTFAGDGKLYTSRIDVTNSAINLTDDVELNVFPEKDDDGVCGIYYNDDSSCYGALHLFDNAKIITSHLIYVYYELALSGNSSIEYDNLDVDHYLPERNIFPGIVTARNIVMSGNSKMNIKSTNDCVSVKGHFAITDNATLDAYSLSGAGICAGYSASGMPYRIFGSDFSASGNAVVNADGHKAGIFLTGSKNAGNFSLKDKASVTATGRSGNASGLIANKVTISGGELNLIHEHRSPLIIYSADEPSLIVDGIVTEISHENYGFQKLTSSNSYYTMVDITENGRDWIRDFHISVASSLAAGEGVSVTETELK